VSGNPDNDKIGSGEQRILPGSGDKHKSYWKRINILTDAIYQVFTPIEASAFTPDEW